jgi:hypothetical protein
MKALNYIWLQPSRPGGCRVGQISVAGANIDHAGPYAAASPSMCAMQCTAFLARGSGA